MVDRYVHCIYYTVSLMSSAIVGDIVPLTLLEQLVVCFITLAAKIFLAFFYSEVSNYISSFYTMHIEHLSTTQQMLQWMRIGSCSQKLLDRVVRYRDYLWQKFKGIDNQALIASMPEMIQRQTQYYILEKLVHKSEVMPQDEHGAILSIVQKLAIKLYPKGEFIIREGEMATEMFFVVEGIVDIYNPLGIKVSRLTEGQCFGEIALLADTVQVRTASAFCVLDVVVAALRKEDFLLICASYPTFKEKVSATAQARRAQNITIRQETKFLEPGKEEDSLEILRTEFLRRATLIRVENLALSDNLSDPEVWTRLEQVRCHFQWEYVIQGLRGLAAIYSIIFVPLQMAFRIEYTAGLYVIETFALLIHTFDLVAAIRAFKRRNVSVWNAKIEPDSSQLTETKTCRKLTLRLACEIVSIIPFSMILQNVYYPTYVVAAIKLLRTIKFWPLPKLFHALKTRWIHIGRILEIIAYYFLIFHVLICLLILMMYVPACKNDSWVKRVPAPLMDYRGYRECDDMSGADPGMIYLHFLYFPYNNVLGLSTRTRPTFRSA
jgi:CRP-like cAMP-binding protein